MNWEAMNWDAIGAIGHQNPPLIAALAEAAGLTLEEAWLLWNC